MKKTKIQWADATFNPWIGCTKVSPGCAHCYAEQTTRARVLRSQGQETWGKGAKRSRTSPATWRGPVKWNRGPLFCDTCGKPFEQLTGKQKLCEPIPDDPCQNRIPTDWPPGFPIPEGRGCTGQYGRPRVFPSLCDWLDDEVPVEWLADFLRLIHDTPNLDWLLLTKRPENWLERISAVAVGVASTCDPELRSRLRDTGHMCLRWLQGEAPKNVWIGTSVEDQARADERIPQLLTIPAKVRFLSVEPLLGPVRIKDALRCDVPIHWVIVGGESGPKARPCNIQHIADVVQQCQAAGVPVFVKHLGSNIRGRNDDGFDGETPAEWPMDTFFEELDPMDYQGAPVSVVLNDPKGGDMAEWPEELRVREFPV